MMNCQDIFCCLADILREEETNLKFARLMVETLNTILLTSSELFSLRNQLKELNARVRTPFAMLVQTKKVQKKIVLIEFVLYSLI